MKEDLREISESLHRIAQNVTQLMEGQEIMVTTLQDVDAKIDAIGGLVTQVVAYVQNIQQITQDKLSQEESDKLAAEVEKLNAAQTALQGILPAPTPAPTDASATPAAPPTS